MDSMLTQVLPNIVVALNQSPLARAQIRFIRAILDFHGYRPVITSVAQHRQEAAPIDFAEPGQFRRMVIERVRQSAHLVQSILVYPRVLQVYTENSRTKIAQWPDVVHFLPYQMGRIVVQAEV